MVYHTGLKPIIGIFVDKISQQFIFMQVQLRHELYLTVEIAGPPYTEYLNSTT